MKNLKSKLRLSLCLLIVCFSTFAQTDSHDCEIVVTRADLEKCATYKRQNEFLEKEVKLQAVGAVSLRDSLKARDNSLDAIKKSLKDETESKLTWRKTTIILAIIIVLLVALVLFGHKLAKFIIIFCLFSAQCFAQAPEYRPPFSLNGQKGLNQKIVFDTTANKFSIESMNDAHIFKIPYGKLFINPGNQFQYYRGDKTWQTLNKSAVGLSNVDNTSDLNKPISTETQGALNLRLSYNNISVINVSDSSVISHTLNTSNVFVTFFDSFGKENNQINYIPVSNSTIRVYLPIRDKPTQKKFSGQILIAKRQ
jgi:hypothetical protein